MDRQVHVTSAVTVDQPEDAGLHTTRVAVLHIITSAMHSVMLHSYTFYSLVGYYIILMSQTSVYTLVQAHGPSHIDRLQYFMQRVGCPGIFHPNSAFPHQALLSLLYTLYYFPTPMAPSTCVKNKDSA